MTLAQIFFRISFSLTIPTLIVALLGLAGVYGAADSILDKTMRQVWKILFSGILTFAAISAILGIWGI